MLDKLKGEISFESGEGHGTTFKVTIPNQQSDNSAASIQNSESV
jgi:signal transduction histidine kinase